MTSDHTPLDVRECARLLSAASVGRVVYTVGALPAVLPVRFRLDPEGSVVFHAAARSELVRAVTGALVAFEASEVSEADGSGWSVTVLGRADVTDEPATPGPAGLLSDPPGDLSDPPGPVTVRIRPELVTGRLLPTAGSLTV